MVEAMALASIVVELQTRYTFHEQLDPVIAIGVAARNNVQHLLLAGYLGHRYRDAGIYVADNEVHLITLDQLARLLHADADIVRRVFNQ